MKFVLFTPVSLKSAIARFSKKLEEKLITLGHQCRIVNTEYRFEESLTEPKYNFFSEIVFWENQSDVELILNQADYLVHQIGDNYSFHAGSLHWIKKYPAVVILHDFFLAHLFYGKGHFEKSQIKDELILNNWYGADLAEQYFKKMQLAENYEWLKDNIPLTEWIAGMANAVITHSTWGIERVKNACRGIVEVLPLPYDINYNTSENIAQKTEKNFLGLLTYGHINQNKRAKSVIEALASSAQLREKVEYTLAGSISDEMRSDLSAFAKNLGVKLIILGVVDEHQLQRIILSADVICCLRYPALEAASASTIEAMHYGKAIIVTDTGFYSELPNHCVYKTSIENEIKDIKNAISFFVGDSEQICAYGENAKKYAKETFCMDKYVKNLIEICSKMSVYNPVIKACDQFAATMLAWGCKPDSILIDELANSLELFEKI